MIRTVIVDDEVLATVGLKAMIDWQAQGYEIVGEGDNGESGLAVIRQTLPDLVITDLKMPGMDGLEMMKRALAEQPGIRFVVLSGYNEFEGVQQALRLGARDYLLKLSLRPDTLLETLALLRRDIRGASTTVPASLSAPESLEIRRDLRHALEGQAKRTTVLYALRAAGIPDDAGMRVLLVRVTSPEDIEAVDRELGGVLVDMIGKLAADFCPSYCFRWDETGFLLLLAGEGEGGAAPDEQETRLIGDSIIQLVGQYVNLDAAVGCSGPISTPEALAGAFHQAEMAADRSFYDGFRQVYRPETSAFAADFPREESSSLEDLAERVAGTSDPAQVETAFRCLIAQMRAARAPRVETLETACHFLTLIDARLGEAWRETAERKALGLHAQVFRIRTFGGLEHFLEQYRDLVVQRLVRLQRDRTEGLVHEARAFIANNLGRRLSLRETAAHLHVSAGYLSTLFPRVTGSRFSDYVNQAKIRQAQDMIRSGRYRMAEIAEALAFQTPSYFGKTFRKFTGCTPSEFARRAAAENKARDEKSASD